MRPQTVRRLLALATRYLKRYGSPSPRLDSELLLGDALGVDRAELLRAPDRTVDEVTRASFRVALRRRGRREPVAYILGRSHFRHLTLQVGPSVLVPRPETEELVEAVLSWLVLRPLGGRGRDAGGRRVSSLQPPLVADVGTGSGCVALSLAAETGLGVLATESSPAALEVARRNAAGQGLEGSVLFAESDLLGDVADGSLRLVVSNPPYVPSSELAGLEPEVRCYEPLSALDGGTDGLAVIRPLVERAARALAPGGALWLEVGHDQAFRVMGLARAAGYSLVGSQTDLSGKERLVFAVKPGSVYWGIETLDEDDRQAVAGALRNGAVVGIPTDTVYGIGAAWDSARGVRALFEAKGRDEKRPVAVLFASVEMIRRSLPDIAAPSARVLENLLPGPYTFVVATRVPRPPLVGTADSLGVRVPRHSGLLALLAGLGVPLAATSANASGGPDARTLEEVDASLLAHCSVVFGSRSDDRRRRPAGGGVAASTVVDLRPLARGGEAEVIREGAVSASEVLARIRALF